MINKSNYFTEVSKIGVGNLTPTLAQGHTMLEKITKNGTNWNISSPTFSEVIEKHLKLLNAFAGKETVKDEADEWADIDPSKIDYEAIQKGTAKPTKAFKELIKAANKAAKPSKTTRKEKAAKKTEKKTVSKPEKMAPKRKVKESKLKVKARQKAVRIKPVKAVNPIAKAPVMVKKFSLELQHIKRYLNMEGKSVKTGSLVSLSKAISKAITLDSYLTHKTLLSEINSKLSSACEKLKESGQQTVDVNLTPEFKAKCKDIISQAKVRVRTEYLAGVEADCDCEKKK